jgi:CRISPR-associated protein Cas5h
MATTNIDVVGRDCLSFTVRGPWAHFRRIDATTEKLTYRVIPRTTVAGLVAAVLGKPRDSYYDTFSPDMSAIAITPQSELKTMSVPMLTLPTEEGDIKTAAGVTGKTVVDPETIGEERKRRTFEYIVNPAYRIDVLLNDEQTFDRVSQMLNEGRSVYTPYLGKSECLASIENVTTRSVESAESAEWADSIVPENHIVPTPGGQLRMERTPAYMRADDSGRRTTGFLSYAYAPGNEQIRVDGAAVRSVGDRNVCFV